VVQHVALTGGFTDAVAYTAVAHAGQVRKVTDVPYLAHLLSVAALVLEHDGDELQATAGVLHDVVEDCGGQRRLEDVRARFGTDVADLVHALSDASPADGERKAP
jgi:(p)ppGpp synthase/HD superfamily hydrolase